jgi:hypothetical protein
LKNRLHVGCPKHPSFDDQDHNYPFQDGLIRFATSNSIPQNYWWQTWTGNGVADVKKKYDLMSYSCSTSFGIYQWAWMLKRHGVSPGPYASDYVKNVKRATLEVEEVLPGPGAVIMGQIDDPPKILAVYYTIVSYTPIISEELADFSLILYHKEGHIISENHYQFEREIIDEDFENETMESYFVVRSFLFIYC